MWIKQVSVIPRSVWIISVSSFFTAVSSVIFASFAPFFFLQKFAINVKSLAYLEGGIESLSFALRMIAGILGDRLGYKIPIMMGYILAIFSRLFVVLAPTFGWSVVGRMSERLGNGLQASPRDAWVSQLLPPHHQGIGHGLRLLCTLSGSMIGGFLGWILMRYTGSNLQSTLLWAILPAILAPLCLMLVKRDRPTTFRVAKDNRLHHSNDNALSSAEVSQKNNEGFLTSLWRTVSGFQRSYWLLLCVSFLLIFGNYGLLFSNLAMKAHGLSPDHFSLVTTVKMIAASIMVYPIGMLNDRVSWRYFVFMGHFALLIAANTFLMQPSLFCSYVGIALLGIYYGGQQNCCNVLIAVHAPKDARGTAFGLFFIAHGFGIFCSNAFMGWAWEALGMNTTFLLMSILLGCGALITTVLRKAVFDVKPIQRH